jgi:hypothetical protein
VTWCERLLDSKTSQALDMEQERQQLIDRLAAEYGRGWADRYKPGSFGCHELLDRTSVAVNIKEHLARQNDSTSGA